jgi:uncharacterized Zn finger protein
MSYFSFGWGDYVSVAEKRRRAEKKIAELKKKGRSIAPVEIEGRKVAKSFWGESWCSNLERYSDYATRLPRGRSYLRNGCVADLQIARGEVTALVVGTDLYTTTIAISPLAAKRWKAICADCSGSINSLVELLKGHLAQNVMERVCREQDGLFPKPDEIRFSCSCLDWADMCKHVAAVLYGIGARLDRNPQLLFTLRGVDESELLAGAGQSLARSSRVPAPTKVLGDQNVAALFGLDMVDSAMSETAPADDRKSSRSIKRVTGRAPPVLPPKLEKRNGKARRSRRKAGQPPTGRRLRPRS